MQKIITQVVSVLALISILCSCDYSSSVPSHNNTISSSSETSSSHVFAESHNEPFIQSPSEGTEAPEPPPSSVNPPSEPPPQGASENSESSKPTSSEGSSAIESSSPIGDCWTPSDSELLEAGGYYDISLIGLIGSDKFEGWLRDHPDSNVYDLIQDFGITDEQLKETLTEDIYAAYKEFWPKQ